LIGILQTSWQCISADQLSPFSVSGAVLKELTCPCFTALKGWANESGCFVDYCDLSWVIDHLGLTHTNLAPHITLHNGALSLLSHYNNSVFVGQSATADNCQESNSSQITAPSTMLQQHLALIHTTPLSE
jgi:hypothetical protein